MIKKKINKILRDALTHFVALILACTLGYFISNGLFGLIGLLISGGNQLVFRLFYSISYLIIVVLVLFFVAFAKEKKMEEFAAHEIVISTMLACIVQIIVALTVVFAIYTIGPALPIAHIIFAGEDINLKFPDTDVPKHLYLICMGVLDLIYIVSTTVGGYFGQKKRRKDRETLYNNTHTV